MSASAGPKIVSDNLIVALDASNTKSYPSTGNTWFDLSNNTIFSLSAIYPTYVPIIPTFNTTTTNIGYFQLTGLNSFTGTAITNFSTSLLETFGTNSATYSLFLKIDSNSNLNSLGFVFDSFRYTSSRGGLFLSLSGSQLTCGLTIRLSSVSLTVPRFYFDKDWSFINIVVDREENFLKLYSNNIFLSSVSISAYSGISILNNTIAFGCAIPPIVQGFPTPRSFLTSGQLGAFFYYKKALSPIEITQNYNTLKSRYEV